MAVAVQANLVQLKVADAKRRGIPTEVHEIKVRSPGTVRRFRETLLDRHALAGHEDWVLRLQLHEAWGQLCAMGWLLGATDAAAGVDFALPIGDRVMQCGASIVTKEAETHAFVWKIRHEAQNRHDPTYTGSADFARRQARAESIPAQAFGKPVAACSDEELLLGDREHLGILAVLRWVLDSRRAWGAAELTHIADEPF